MGALECSREIVESPGVLAGGRSTSRDWSLVRGGSERIRRSAGMPRKVRRSVGMPREAGRSAGLPRGERRVAGVQQEEEVAYLGRPDQGRRLNPNPKSKALIHC